MIRSTPVLATAFLVGLLACTPAERETRADVADQIAELAKRVDAIEKRLATPQVAQAPPRAAEDFDTLHSIELGAAPVLGPKDAPLTLVVYSDFQCPFCARAEPLLQNLKAKYPGKLRLAFKHFPLSFHAAARPLALAAMAAQEQGKFWEFHDVVFKHSGALDASQEGIEGYAKEAGLDLKRFRKDLETRRDQYEARIEQDLRQGEQVEVHGTPTFYLNGRKLDPRTRSLEGMSAAFDRALSEQG